MIGIDTNILVRFITRDDPGQTLLASSFMDSLTIASRGFISLIVVAELYWVLNHSYRATRPGVVRTFEALLFSSELVIEDVELVHEALEAYENGNADFDDYLIAKCAQKFGCQEVVTFDRKAASSVGMRLLR